ncbi:MAG: hypothetical protein MJZ76_07795, partial [Bacteroidales bacterium]|nr:hypothetical protein [Bacteroidales bacterium]
NFIGEYKMNILVTIDKKYSIHYIGNTISSTMKWKIDQRLPAVSYQSISFRLGLSDAQNVTHYFLNAPESNMAWPDALGGGYHYMMINGKWLSNNILKPFNFHLGRGQIYDGDNITGYIDNSFVVTIPHSGFFFFFYGTSLTLDMNVNQWFNAVEPFDFEYFGGSIMTNQEAQEVARKNGVKAFSIK